MSQKQIVIIGGGFAGLYTALRLIEFPWDNATRPEILLIDRQDHFVFSPLLYEVVNEEMQPWEVAPPYASLLNNHGIHYIQAEVTAIDIAAKRVICTGVENGVDDGRTHVDYDYLVIAAGGITKSPDIPGIRRYALPFKNVGDALSLKHRLRDLEQSPVEKIRVAVVGGGYSGVELACKLADRLGDRGRLRLIDRGSEILKNAPKFNQSASRDALTAKEIWVDYETEVVNLTAYTISLKYKEQIDEIPVDLVLWTAGNAIAPWIKTLDLPHGDGDRLKVNAHLQIIDHPQIFALGDVAQGEDNLPMTAQVAIQQADICAWNLRALIEAKPLLPFRFYNLGEMLTLGENNATLSGLGIELDGNLAHLIRRMVYLYRLPTWQHQLNVGLNWMMQPLVKLLANQH